MRHKNLAHILSKTGQELLALPQMGKTTFQSLTDALEEKGIYADKLKSIRHQVMRKRISSVQGPKPETEN